jgi:hypothetical protein
VAFSAARFTEASSTPSILFKDLSTAREHAEQVIPFTINVFF